MLLAARARHLAGDLELLPAAAGLHVAGFFARRTTDSARLVDRALAAGVAVEALSGYYRRGARAGLAIGYGLIPTPRIEPGIRRLAACLRG